MAETLTKKEESVLAKVGLKRDYSKLNDEEKMIYVDLRSRELGINSVNKPIEWHTFDGRLVPYLTPAGGAALMSIHGISVYKQKEKFFEHNGECFYLVKSYGVNQEGRKGVGTGVVGVQGLKGKVLENAFMKAETKAQRRLAIKMTAAGLLDATEVEDLTPAATVDQEPVIIEEADWVVRDLSMVTTKEGLSALWNTLDEDAQSKYAEKFTERRKQLGL